MKYLANKNKFDFIKPYLLILPCIIILSFCIYGIMNCALQAFGIMNVIGLKHFTFKYIKEVFANKKFVDALIYTFYLAFTQSLISIVIGFLISLYLIKNDIKKYGFLYTPLAIPHIVVCMFTLLLFAENGVISRLLCTLHIINGFENFPNIIYNNEGFGVIIAYVWKSTAYVLSVIYVVMKNNNFKYFEVAKSMKLSYTRYVIDIILPLTKIQLISTFLILFAYSFGSYEVPFLLSKTTHKTLPIYAYEEFLNPDIYNRPIAQSYNVIMILIGIIIIAIYYKLITRGTYEKK